MYAFRCRNCGHLEPAAHAGECHCPHACCVCGSGVNHVTGVKEISAELCKPDCTPERRLALAADLERISRTGGSSKSFDPDNWEILSRCSAERLAELGLCADDVCHHAPLSAVTPTSGKNLAVNISDTVKSQDVGG